MTKCHFICNDLLGTNFDYCNLQDSDFAERETCKEQINWLGKGFSIISNLNKFKDSFIKI